jgi:hypothetical protein
MGQFKLTIDDDLLAQLKACAEDYEKPSANQVAVEILSQYLPFWRDAAELHRQVITEQYKNMMGVTNLEILKMVKAKQAPGLNKSEKRSKAG